jgi:hypothetical protein
MNPQPPSSVTSHPNRLPFRSGIWKAPLDFDNLQQRLTRLFEHTFLRDDRARKTGDDAKQGAQLGVVQPSAFHFLVNLNPVLGRVPRNPCGGQVKQI